MNLEAGAGQPPPTESGADPSGPDRSLLGPRPPDPWPLRHLVLRTPRLELRPDDDAGLDELVEETYRGIHAPERMPFVTPWTEADPADLGRLSLQHHWSVRAALRPERWTLNFLVRCDGRVIGTQGLEAVDFAVTGEVETGSWLGLRHQGRGFGTEMRAAVLIFAFDHLGADRARSSAFLDNPASLRVSDKLGYRRDGLQIYARRGERAENTRLALTPEAFRRPPWTLGVEGVAGCLAMLGARQGRDPGRRQEHGTPHVRPDV